MAKAKGSEKTGGRTVGTPNKLTQSVKDVFATTFATLQEDPVNNLNSWGKENPTEFYKLCSKLIPTAMDVKLDNNIIKVIVPNKK
jgi:hypothetical protein